ncbi:MAG: TonB-dependent receptor [Alphaproteobacteria bacterium]
MAYRHFPMQSTLLGSLTFLALIAPGYAQDVGDTPPPPPPAAEVAVDGDDISAESSVDEIVVTASRREETLQDYVGGIQVFSGADLDAAGAKGIEDVVYKIPGAGFKKEGNGTTSVALRGISNLTQVFNGFGDGVSTVGIYINDVPIRGAASMPDIGLYDLSRVEVLKGPQGTLYGEGAMGGAIRLLLEQPSKDSWAYKADASYAMTRGGDDSYGVRMAAGGPVSDKVSVRLVGTYRLDGGFVDYVNRGTENEDEARSWSGRMLLDWEATDRFKANVLVLIQDSELDNYHEVDPREGELKNSINEDRFNNTDFQFGAVTLKHEFNFAELTSVSGYFSSYRESQLFSPLLTTLVPQAADLTLRPVLGPLAGPISGALVTVFDDIIGGNIITEELQFFNTDQESLSQEFRLVSTNTGKWHWIAGLYGSKTETSSYQNQNAPDLPGESRIITANGTEIFEQLSAYGEVVYYPWDPIKITGGLRAFYERTDIYQLAISHGALGLAQIAAGQGAETITDHESDSRDILPKLSIAWDADDWLNVYVLASKGFRSGGNNVASTFHEFKSYEPDYLWNYELGLKSRFWGGRLSVNMSAYYLDWSDTQAVATVTGSLGGVPAEFIAIQNVGQAEVYGSEIELAAIADWAMLFASLGLNRSEILSSDESGTIIPGEPLPNQPELTASVSLNLRPFTFDFGVPYLQIDWTYTDEQFHLAKTNSAPDGDLAPAFDLLNLRFGVEAEAWAISLFANNVTDERPVLSRSALREGESDQIFSTSRPRTIGLQARSNF